MDTDLKNNTVEACREDRESGSDRVDLENSANKVGMLVSSI